MNNSTRNYKRFPVFAIADLHCGEDSVTAMVDNFSLGGMGLYCLHPIKLNTPVEATIKFVTKEGIQRAETVKGTVVWSIRHENIYMMG